LRHGGYAGSVMASVMAATERLWQRLIYALDALRARSARGRARDAEQAPERAPRAEPPLVSSRPLFALSPELLASLRATRPWCDYEDRVLWEHDAFLLDPGGDDPSYLSSDGRLLWLQRHAACVPTRARAFAALAVGAKQTGISGLRALLPERSAHAETCVQCAGSGFRAVPPDVEPRAAACELCAGLGWTSAELDLRAPLS
jgi:hypothetical protein